MKRRIVLLLGALVAPLLVPVPAPAIGGYGRFEVLETRIDPTFRAVPDLRGGMWLQTAYGIKRRFAPQILAPGGGGHLAADPTTGDLVHDGPEGITRVTGEGVVTVLASTEAAVTALDVGPDGTVWFNDARGVQRMDGDGSGREVLPFSNGANAVVATDEDSIVFASGAALFRWDDGSAGPTLVAGAVSEYCNPPDPCGNNGPALDARFGEINQLDVAFDTILIGQLHGLVRSLGADGIVRRVLGGWERCYLVTIDCGVGGGALFGLLDNVMSMAVDGTHLYVVDQSGRSSSSRLVHVDPWATAPPSFDQGYRMVASDGGVFTFGWSPFHGSTGAIPLVSPIVAGRSNGAEGYWFVAGDGGVFAFGDAGFHGSAAGATSSPVVDMAVREDGDGYWVLERNGAVHAFGAAPFCGHARLLGPFAAIVDAPDGEGYALVAEDGRQYGLCRRPGGAVVDLPSLNAPIVAAHRTASGEGLWLVAADGGVFTQGDAGFFGSTGAMRLNQPVLDLVPTPSEEGYWLLAADGGVFTFGDAQFQGSMGAVRLNRPVVAGVAGPSPSG